MYSRLGERSKSTTLWPASVICRAAWLPMRPAPVMRMFIIDGSSVVCDANNLFDAQLLINFPLQAEIEDLRRRRRLSQLQHLGVRAQKVFHFFTGREVIRWERRTSETIGCERNRHFDIQILGQNFRRAPFIFPEISMRAVA